MLKSGVRIGTLVKLDIGDIEFDRLIRGEAPVAVLVPEHKNKGKFCAYRTFIDREACEALRLYLEHRRRGTGKIPPEALDPDSPLFATRTRVPKRLRHKKLDDHIRELMRRAGIRGVSSHSFRKWFRTKLAMSGIPQDVVEYFLGHKQSVYVRIHEMPLDELRKPYAKADLSIGLKTATKEVVKEALRALLRSFNMEANDDQLDALLEKRERERAYKEIAEKLHEAIIRAVSPPLESR